VHGEGRSAHVAPFAAAQLLERQSTMPPTSPVTPVVAVTAAVLIIAAVTAFATPRVELLQR
jgi:hypothetical protein